VAINENKEQAKEDEHGIKFEFDEKENIYRCSQGQNLAPIFGMKHDRRRGTEAQAYKGTNCQPCPIKKLCTTSTSRSVYRFTNQQWRDHYRSKLKSKIGISKLKLRKCLSEHPFGTIKCWMGHVPILLRRKEKVQTEINIYVIAYNFKRMLTITSFEGLEKLFRPVPS